MKPDDFLLSAYLDGEVPERFVPEIKSAVADDPEIHKRLEQLQQLRAAMHLDEIPELRERMDESWSCVQRRLSVRKRKSALSTRFRQVHIPLPAAAAAALVIVALGALLVWRLLPGRPMTAPDYLAQGRDVDVTIRVDNAEMEQVLKWLVDQDMLGEVNIQLPEQQFQIMGEPVFVKPGDYAGGFTE